MTQPLDSPLDSVTSLLPTFHTALEQEEAASPQKGQPGSLISLQQGHRRGVVNGHTHYQFIALDGHHALPS